MTWLRKLLTAFGLARDVAKPESVRRADRVLSDLQAVRRFQIIVEKKPHNGR